MSTLKTIGAALLFLAATITLILILFGLPFALTHLTYTLTGNTYASLITLFITTKTIAFTIIYTAIHATNP